MEDRAMGSTVRDVMTPDPICVQSSATIAEAARQMRDHGVGDVIVMDDSRIRGIVTDRDTVVRAVAEERDVRTTRVGDIASGDLVCIAPTDDVDRAVSLMRERAVRRLPVVENDRPVGILSLGDLAMDRDQRSVLAEISSAPTNR
jgi:CBS domain-containing protein